jgi:hypothetical protein
MLHYVLFVLRTCSLILLTATNLYVIGFLLNMVVAEPFVQPLNNTVVFFKETEIVFTSDT